MPADPHGSSERSRTSGELFTEQLATSGELFAEQLARVASLACARAPHTPGAPSLGPEEQAAAVREVLSGCIGGKVPAVVC